MDHVKRALTIEDFWTPSVLQELIIKCAFHAQGHPRKCRCPWCFQGDTLRIILHHRPDLVHGDHCGEGCRHVRAVASRGGAGV